MAGKVIVRSHVAAAIVRREAAARKSAASAQLPLVRLKYEAVARELRALACELGVEIDDEERRRLQLSVP
jgi:hypothetical protein